jgi:hypothetical protein
MKKNAKRVIVFIAGGAAFSEVRSMNEIEREFPNRQIIIGIFFLLL